MMSVHMPSEVYPGRRKSSLTLEHLTLIQTSPVIWNMDVGTDATTMYVGEHRCIVGTADGAGKSITDSGLIPGLRPANERRRYFVTTSLIGWAQT